MHLQTILYTMQINVMTNTQRIPGSGKNKHCKSQIYENENVEIFIKYYSEISSRFCWVSFHTKRRNRKHRVIFAPLSFIANKEEVSLIWVQLVIISIEVMRDRLSRKQAIE